MTGHNDGSFVIWDPATGEQREPPSTPYGPYPCKAINKIHTREAAEEGSWSIFSGGMPRASYGDKFTVSVMRSVNDEEQHSVFDLSSKVIDWVVTDHSVTGTPECLMVLSEEELVCVDLITQGWPSLACPYMQSIHSSAITAQISL